MKSIQQICVPVFALHVGYPQGITKRDQEIDPWLQSDLEPISWSDFIWEGMRNCKCLPESRQNFRIELKTPATLAYDHEFLHIWHEVKA
jgi:hypothetical protein